MASLLFDIETAPLDDAADYLEPASAPSNYKDEAKIAAYVAEEQAKQLGKCALDPDLCRVVALGAWHRDWEGPEVFCVSDGKTEAEMLHWFWSYLSLPGLQSWIGFNVLSFDLPVLLRRSLYLGVTAPKLTLNKYRPGRVVDLLQELTHQGLLKYRSQEFYCKRFGIQVDDPVTDSAQIPALVDAGDWATITAHCRADLCRLHGLATRLGYLQPTGKELCAVEPQTAMEQPF